MKSVRLMTILAVLVLSLYSEVRAAGDCQLKPGERDRCAVCGMFVKPYPNWVAAIKWSDGAVSFFDGPKDMFKYLFHMAKYNKQKTRDDVAAVYVTEFYSTKLMAAADVLFVVGSDVMGPMGKELIPVEGEDNARTFLKDHHGEKVLKFDEISPEAIP